MIYRNNIYLYLVHFPLVYQDLKINIKYIFASNLHYLNKASNGEDYLFALANLFFLPLIYLVLCIPLSYYFLLGNLTMDNHKLRVTNPLLPISIANQAIALSRRNAGLRWGEFIML